MNVKKRRVAWLPVIFFLSEDGLLTTFVQQRKEDDENDKRPETADKSRI